jgi:hypothetical protein
VPHPSSMASFSAKSARSILTSASGTRQDSPGRRNDRPRALPGRNIVARQVIPPLAVLSYVLGKVIDGAPYDLDADPMWASPLTENFNVMQGSPCIGAGVDVGVPYSGSAPDIGAVEHSSRPPTQRAARSRGREEYAPRLILISVIAPIL